MSYFYETGKKIKMLIDSKNINRRKMVKDVGITSLKKLKQIERGEVALNIHEMIRIASYLGVSIGSILPEKVLLEKKDKEETSEFVLRMIKEYQKMENRSHE